MNFTLFYYSELESSIYLRKVLEKNDIKVHYFDVNNKLKLELIKQTTYPLKIQGLPTLYVEKENSFSLVEGVNDILLFFGLLRDVDNSIPIKSTPEIDVTSLPSGYTSLDELKKGTEEEPERQPKKKSILVNPPKKKVPVIYEPEEEDDINYKHDDQKQRVDVFTQTKIGAKTKKVQVSSGFKNSQSQTNQDFRPTLDISTLDDEKVPEIHYDDEITNKPKTKRNELNLEYEIVGDEKGNISSHSKQREEELQTMFKN